MGWLDDIAKNIERFGKETTSDIDRIVRRVLGEDER